MISYTSLWRTVRDHVNHMRLPFLTPQTAREQAGNERLYDASSDLAYEPPVENLFGRGYITSNILQESEEEHGDDDRDQDDDDEVRTAETYYILKNDEESKDHFNPQRDYIPFDSPSDGEQSNEKKENAKENDNDNESQVDGILVAKTTFRSAQREEECDYISLNFPTQQTATQKLDSSGSKVEYVRQTKIPTISAQREEHAYISLDVSPEESAANLIEDSGYVSVSEKFKSQKAAEPIFRAPSASSDGTASTIHAIPRRRRPVSHRMICDNCNHVGHLYMQCIKPCVLCGNPKHRSPECEKAIQQKGKDEQKSSPKKRKADENSEAERMKKRIRVSIEGECATDERLRDGRKFEDLHDTGAENRDFGKMDGIAAKGHFYPGLASTAQNVEKSMRSKKRIADYDEKGNFAAAMKRARLSHEGQGHSVYPGYSISRGGYNLYPGLRAVCPSEKLFRKGYSYKPFVNSGPVGYTHSSQVQYPEYGFEFVQEDRARNTSAAAYPTYNSYNTRPHAIHDDGYFSYNIGNEHQIRDVKPRANNESACLSLRQDHVDDDGNAYDDLEWEELVNKLEATNKRVE